MLCAFDYSKSKVTFSIFEQYILVKKWEKSINKKGILSDSFQIQNI
jgi:hypothetical protein